MGGLDIQYYLHTYCVIYVLGMQCYHLSYNSAAPLVRCLGWRGTADATVRFAVFTFSATVDRPYLLESSRFVRRITVSI